MRSSANISNGGKTQWANVFHGIFILVALVFFPTVINLIPLSSLAALLCFTGYKLASPHEFVQMYLIGKAQFTVFITTIIAVLLTDLLIGILIGILVKILTYLYYGVSLKGIFSPTISVVVENECYGVCITDSVVFTHYPKIRTIISQISEKQFIQIDFALARFIDHSVLEKLIRLKNQYNQQGGNMMLIGLENFIPLSRHPR